MRSYGRWQHTRCRRHAKRLMFKLTICGAPKGYGLIQYQQPRLIAFTLTYFALYPQNPLLEVTFPRFPLSPKWKLFVLDIVT